MIDDVTSEQVASSRENKSELRCRVWRARWARAPARPDSKLAKSTGTTPESKGSCAGVDDGVVSLDVVAVSLFELQSFDDFLLNGKGMMFSMTKAAIKRMPKAPT